MTYTDTEAPPEIRTIWQPLPTQEALFDLPPNVVDVLYAGGRGGGKSDAILGEFAFHAQQYAHSARGLCVRRELKQLRDLIARSKELYLPIGGRFNGSSDEWTFPNGATLMFGCIEQDSDHEKYQGYNRSRIYVDEIGTFPSPEPLDKLKATLRSSAATPRFIATGNFVGRGQGWVKARYVDPSPSGWQPFPILDYNGKPTGEYRVWIPSTIKDNPYLNTPAYIAKLMTSGSPKVVQAYLTGDPNVIEGQYFPEFDTKVHVIPYFRPPSNWTRIHGMDWGGAAPWANLWVAVVPEETSIPEPLRIGDHHFNKYRYTGGLPKGSLVVYRELYIAEKQNGVHINKGLNLDALKVAGMILDAEHGEDITYRVAGLDLWTTRSGPSIAERMGKHPYNLHFRRAKTERTSATAKAHNIGGWDNVRSHLVGQDDRPRLYITDNCVDLIRCLPLAQHDPNNPEDMASGEDHNLDALRYIIQSRPYISNEDTKPDRWRAASYNGNMYVEAPGLDEDTYMTPRPKLERIY